MSIDEKLHAAIDMLNSKQKKELLFFVDHIREEETYDKWKDDSFVAEMEKRYQYYKSGGKMVSATDANKQIKRLLEKGK